MQVSPDDKWFSDIKPIEDVEALKKAELLVQGEKEQLQKLQNDLRKLDYSKKVK